MLININMRRIIAGLMLASSIATNAAPISAITSGSQAPVVIDSPGTRINYVQEHVGKKIAIRQAFLVPYPKFNQKRCADQSRCSDFFESVSLFVEVQSIWPEPVLLTAATLKKVGLQSTQPDPGFFSERALSERITRQWSPDTLLLQPGQVKLFHLEQGIRLDGILDFFTEDVRDELVSCDREKCALHNLIRISEFNKFLAQRYGARASLHLTIFEKDYRPILKTTFQLTDGSDIFSTGDTRKNSYKLQHDVFLAESLFTIRGGKSFMVRRLSDEIENRD